MLCFADGPSLRKALRDGLEAKIALLDHGACRRCQDLELLGAMIEQGIALPVIFLTGHSLTERDLHALDHGTVDFVDKMHGTGLGRWPTECTSSSTARQPIG